LALMLLVSAGAAAQTQQMAPEMLLRAAMEAKDPTEKVAKLEELLATNPQDQQLRNFAESELAMAYEEKGDTQKALLKMREVLARDTENGMWMQRLRMAEMMVNHNRELDEAAKLAVEGTDIVSKLEKTAAPGMPEDEFIKARDAQVAHGLEIQGRIESARGNHDKARAALDQAMQLAPGEPGPRFALAKALDAAGDSAKALETITSIAVAKGEDGPQYLELYRQLYAKVNGSDAGIDAELEKLRKAAEARELDEYKAQLVNKAAPAGISFKSLDGAQTTTLDSYKGKVLFLNFWATWCGPCRVELPHFQKAYEAMNSDSRVAFLAVSTDTGPGEQKIPEFIANGKYTFPIALGSDALAKFGYRGIPALAVIGPDGNIRFERTGFDPSHDMTEEFQRFVTLLTAPAEAKVQ